MHNKKVNIMLKITVSHKTIDRKEVICYYQAIK